MVGARESRAKTNVESLLDRNLRLPPRHGTSEAKPLCGVNDRGTNRCRRRSYSGASTRYNGEICKYAERHCHEHSRERDLSIRQRAHADRDAPLDARSKPTTSKTSSAAACSIVARNAWF